MKVPEAAIAQVVLDASERIADAEFISGRVDQLIRAQPHIMQYVVAHKQELSVEDIVQVLFHAAMIHESVVRATGRNPSIVGYAELDAAATAVPTLEALADREGDVASYIFSNIDLDGGEHAIGVARTILAHIAAALIEAS